MKNTDKQPALEPFTREERYIVIKRKLLNKSQEAAIKATIGRMNVSTVECVVVESDWPEYEKVWNMIENRCSSKLPALKAVAFLVGHPEYPKDLDFTGITNADKTNGWTETPLADLSRANEIIAGLEARIESLHAVFKRVDEALWSVSGRKPRREPQVFVNALDEIEKIVTAALKEDER